MVSTEAIALAAATPIDRVLNSETNRIHVFSTAQALVTVKNAAGVAIFAGLVDASTPLVHDVGVTTISVTLLSTPGATMYFNQISFWSDN